MQSKKGFTLVELLVVVGILSIALMLITPTLKDVSFKSKENVTTSNLELLNFSTKSYASFHELEFQDIFEGVETDEQRMQLLISNGLIEKTVEPIDQTKIFCWNVSEQVWIISATPQKKGCGGSYSTSSFEDGTLTVDSLPTAQPTTYPSAVATNKPIVTDEQKKCLASGGKFDPVNQICVCGDGLVLNKDSNACISNVEYLCTQSGGSYDSQSKACACPEGSELSETKAMCIGIKVK